MEAEGDFFLPERVTRQADEVEVFEMFGGDLPVHDIQPIAENAKGSGDRSDKRTARMQKAAVDSRLKDGGCRPVIYFIKLNDT